MNFQIVKINGFDKAVFAKSGSCDALELFDVGIEPDRLAEIQLPDGGYASYGKANAESTVITRLIIVETRPT